MRLAAIATGAGSVLLVACSSGQAPSGSNSDSRTASPGGSALAASYARAHPLIPQPGADSGTIAGALAFPSEFLPAQAIYAITVDGASF